MENELRGQEAPYTHGLTNRKKYGIINSKENG